MIERRSRDQSFSSLRNTTSACVKRGSASLHSHRRYGRHVRVRRPLSATNASSRFWWPVCARRSSGVPDGDDLAARDHDDGVAERGDFLHHVAREQHGVAFALEAADDLAHRARAHHVEAVGRLVEQHVLRVVDDGAGQRGLGALAVREAGDAAIGDRRSCRASSAGDRCALRRSAPVMPCSSPK